jgi:hypothetical protein
MAWNAQRLARQALFTTTTPGRARARFAELNRCVCDNRRMSRDPVDRWKTYTRTADVPYNPQCKPATRRFWAGAITHRGLAELRAKRGRPAKAVADRAADFRSS